MKAINTYLMFDGNCAEAMKFYQKCLKADLVMSPYSEMPGEPVPPEMKDRIMHAKLTKGSAVLMAPDIKPNPDFKIGNNFTLAIDCESKQEVDDFANALKVGGKVTMPNQETFWGAYFGMLTDKYGIDWMLNYDVPKAP